MECNRTDSRERENVGDELKTTDWIQQISNNIMALSAINCRLSKPQFTNPYEIKDS